LQKLHEEQHQWTEAARVRETIARLDAGRRPENRAILAFLRNQVGAALAESGDRVGAARAFEAAIDEEPRTAPAYLNLGDMREQRGDVHGAIAAWEQLVQLVPDRAYLAFDRLERAYRSLEMPRRFVELCHRVIAANPQDWRARLALSRHYMSASQPRDAFELLLSAVPYNPHGLAIHQAIWRALTELGLDAHLVHRYTALTRDAVFYLDPHVCTRCRYRSTELLWQCPQCHEWNTFVEEKLSPATDAAADMVGPLE
jgi:lipopolysaccharide biosynthesis regulator YciM